MKRLPQNIPELAEWLAKGITKTAVATDTELDRIRRQLEDLETVVTEVRDQLAEMDH